MNIYDVVLESPYGESGIRNFQVEAEDLEEAKFWIGDCTIAGKEKIISISQAGESSDPSKD